jgi:hypothetical protein
MNDILKDIDKLKELQAIAEYFSRGTLISHLEDMIREKQKIVHNFEKTFKEEECRK